MLYDRQQSLSLSIPSNVAVIGCGGTGSWVALGLALTGVPLIHLFDPDYFEEHNFNRIPLPLSSIGQNKAEALASFLRTLRPETNFTTNRVADSLSLSLVSPLVIIDCTDSSEFQSWLSNYCKESKITYIRSGYNGGDHVTITNRLSTFRTSLPLESRYAVQPSWYGGAALAGSFAAIKAVFLPDFEFVGSISQISQSKKEKSK